VIGTPAQLADTLAALPVRVSSVEVRASTAPIDDYPGGARPTSTVCLFGEGRWGFGENVAFAVAEHDSFAAHAGELLYRTGDVVAGRVDGLVRPESPRYERAALEAALIDLALRQAGISIADLTGKPSARMRFVVSFEACSHPAERVRRLRAAGCASELKVDVDPSWDRPTGEELAREPGVAILDFKGRGDPALVARLAALCPGVIFEDPPAGGVGPRITRDAPLVDARAVAAALARNEGINLKAPRMGGPLELLRGLDLAVKAGAIDDASSGQAMGPTAYIGGMFEVGAGRAQARQVAALFCAHGPNDLGPIDGPAAERLLVSSPVLIRLDTPGFGASPS
jgi:hypothetical protein